MPRPPHTVTRPHLVNATLPAPKWPPAVGQCGQVGVVELFIIFCDTPALPLNFFAFVLYFLFFLLCFAAALFLARVPFCAYAILVYLLAILLAMNLFVFIVKPAAELPQNTNKQRPTFAAAPPSSATLSAPPHLALKGCRLASRTELFVGCVWLFCSQMNVIYIFNNESDSHRTRFRLPPSASVFKTFKFKYIFYALIYCSLVFSRAHINVGCA